MCKLMQDLHHQQHVPAVASVQVLEIGTAAETDLTVAWSLGNTISRSRTTADNFRTERVHVLLHDIVWPPGVFYLGALGPTYLIRGYLAPQGMI